MSLLVALIVVLQFVQPDGQIHSATIVFSQTPEQCEEYKANHEGATVYNGKLWVHVQCLEGDQTEPPDEVIFAPLNKT